MAENATFWAVVGVAVTSAIVHTAAGPDHYIPFIVLAKARKWSYRKTMGLTLMSGFGHVFSAILLAVLFSVASEKISGWSHGALNDVRGSLAAWMLAALGTLYTVWGIVSLACHRGHSHSHPHIHSDGTVHDHPHAGTEEHAHVHGDRSHRFLLAWSLFIIFVLGPCEALLPVLAASASVGVSCLYLSTVLFSVATIATMMGMVTAGYYGLRQIAFPLVERYSHVIAGTMIALCGFGMIFLGL